MDELRLRLRKFYLIATLASVAVFGILFAIFHGGADAQNEGALTVEGSYYTMIVLLGVTFFGFAATSLYLRKANGLKEDEEGDTLNELADAARYERAYKVRVGTLSGLSVLSSVCYCFTHDENCIYLVGIMTLILLLTYPTKSFILKR